ncbi:MAG: hypothetical protein HY290_32500 [Planctomycetia bacterium]|nr:hypothetical protein [Planctomycetia bacterium]
MIPRFRRFVTSVPRRCGLGFLIAFSLICFWPLWAAGQDNPRSVETVRREVAWQIVEAADAAVCRVEGRSSIQIYPRSVGRQSVFLFEGSRLTVTTKARAVYLRLPTVFATPGPRYSDFADARLRIRIDERPWKEIALATARQEWPIAEDLPAGEHQVVVEPVGTMSAVDGFRFAPEPLSGLFGTIVGSGYSELLTDVRADVFSEGKRVRTEYVRSPLTGNFEIWGIAPGTYKLRLTAAGWLPHEIPEVVIRQPGQRVDLGIIAVTRDPRCGGRDLQHREGPRFGRSLSIQPGQSFTTHINHMGVMPTGARLVSPFKSIDVRISDSRMIELGTANNVGVATFTVPQSTPYDMYDLHLSFAGAAREQTSVLAQAVSVREPLPPDFHVAGIGHMNTWGQQTAEYLAQVARVAELAGARTLLVSNEVNAAYVSGAFQDLRIPYLVTAGNHTMPRWDEYFGSASVAHDDGSLRVVTFGRSPTESWHEAGRMIRERPDATNRVLLCYEGYAPIDLIRDGQVDLLFDGHSDRPHADTKSFPPGTLHMRAPTQETIRWIPMNHQGISSEIRTAEDVPVLNVPRSGPAPLRLNYTAANDGSALEQTAVITNEYPQRFPHARIRFLMRAGRYRLEGGKPLQTFESDAGTTTVIDAEVDVPAQKDVTVTIRAE